jgi:hypothetical protein
LFYNFYFAFTCVLLLLLFLVVFKMAMQQASTSAQDTSAVTIEEEDGAQGHMPIARLEQSGGWGAWFI